MAVFLSFIGVNRCAYDPGMGDGDARFSVFFNEPGKDRESMVDKFVDLELVKIIDEAEESVLLSVYNFDKQSIIDAILRAKERNIEVKVVGDIDEFYTYGYQEMQHNDIDMSLGNSSGIQHNKFAVIDNRLVFTGTGNMSNTGISRNNNNWYIIENQSMAAHYRREFIQMYSGMFAARKRPRSLERIFTVNGSKVEIFFSPYEGEEAMERLIELVNGAQTSVHYMIFAHTHDELAGAMIYTARQRGIPVYGIHDSTFVSGVSEEAPRIYSSSFNNDGTRNPTGPFNRWDGNENTSIKGNPGHGGKMHCKTLIIDAGTPNAKLATGSFNWSNNAINNNDENMLVINDAKIANTIYEQFKQAWAISNDLSTRVKKQGHTAEPHDIIISEVNWAGSATATSLSQSDDFVEIFNASPEPINLSHWNLQWGPNKFRNIYPLPDRHNWYYEVQSSCADFSEYLTPQDNVICPGTYKIFYADKASAFAPPSEDENIVYNEDGAAIYTKVGGISEFRISGTKGFKLSNAEFKVRLFDKAMNLIDEAGDGFTAPAGSMDTSTKTAHSMERRKHTSKSTVLDGKSQAAWFTAQDKYTCGHWSELFDNCSNAAAGNTYASAGKVSGSVPAPDLLSATLLSSTELQLTFNSSMSNCTTAGTSFTLDTIPTGGAPTAYTLAQDPQNVGFVKLTATTGSFTTIPTLFSVKPETACKDVDNTSATAQTIVFNGYDSNLAKVLLNTVSTSSNWVEIKALTNGSVRNLKLYYYNESSLYLVHQFAELAVNQNDTMVVSTSKTSTDILKNEDKYNLDGSGGARNGSPFHINSTAPSLTGTEAVLVLSYCGIDAESSEGCALPNYGIQDVVYYTNRDGSVSSGFAKGPLRSVYFDMKSFWPISELPISGLNDREIQRDGICIKEDESAEENSAFNCSSACKGVKRTNDDFGGKTSWRCETTLTIPGY